MPNELFFDVVVAGFGTAGAMAAIAAARRNVRVLVLEKTTYPGGMQTGGGIIGYYSAAPEGGLMAEVDEKVAAAAAKYACAPAIEARKFVLENCAAEAGAQIRYEATVCEVLRHGNQITGVRFVQNDALYTVNAAMVIDATADAAIIRLADCPTAYGRDSDRGCNPFTNIAFGRNGGGLHAFNFDAGRIDFRDAEDFSATLLRSNLVHLRESYQAPGSYELAFSDVPGVRESFRIVGERIQTVADTLESKTGDYEVIAWACSNLDCHMFDPALESRFFRDWIIGASMWGTQLSIPVCRRTLVPRGAHGLLAAGRHLSVEHDLSYAVRMNAAMGRIGEAAGAWAALCVRRNTADPLAVPFAELEAAIGRAPDHATDNAKLWPGDRDAITRGLTSDAPGFAMWAARKPELAEFLKQLYDEAPAGSNLRCHSALALALHGDPTGLPELRRMAAERDAFRPRTCRKYNFLRACSAIYALGRLADAESVETLGAILSDRNIQVPPHPHFYDAGNYHALATVSLLEIGLAHPEVRRRAFALLEEYFNQPDFTLMVPLKSSELGYDVGPIYRAYCRGKMAGVCDGV